jgi:hypothetical protein
VLDIVFLYSEKDGRLSVTSLCSADSTMPTQNAKFITTVQAVTVWAGTNEGRSRIFVHGTQVGPNSLLHHAKAFAIKFY